MKKISFLLLCIALVLCGCTKKVIYIQDEQTVTEELSVAFLDMKYGCATLIETEKTKILIGCGGAEDFPELYEHMRSNGVTELDAVIIPGGKAYDGGFQKIMANFPVTDIYVPEECRNIAVYRTLSELASDKTQLYIASDGTEIYSRGGIHIDVISSGEYNNEPYLSLYISYGEISFLLEGNGDLVAERELILGVGDFVKADVLTVPHCGTHYLPSEEFMEAVKPFYGVVPVYGDETPQLILQRQFDKKGIKLLRTDTDGNITFVTDGKNIKYYHTK